jgi:glyoxylase-like metal-dependent hydrolase (beta-lactamase superfamily II)
MPRLIHIICLSLFAAHVQATERGPEVPDYPADKVADNVYVIHGPLQMPNPENQGFMNNPGIVITDAGLVILDPGSSVQSGEMVLRVAGKLSDKPVVAVFNSHVHGDHWLGNQAVRAAWPDAAIYGHPVMISMIADGEGNSWVELMDQMTEGKTRGTTVVAPDKAVDHGDEIKVGNYTFRMHHYGKAHTPTDIMVEIVEPGIVFLGDIVMNGRVTRLDDGDIPGNIRSCTEILKTGATIYVPGHGQSGNRSLVDRMHTYLDTVYSSVQVLFEDGLSDFEMKDAISAKLQAYADWEDFDVQLGKHISFAYLKIEAEAF